MTAEPVHAPEAAHHTDPACFERERGRIFRRARRRAGHVSDGQGVGRIHDLPEAADLIDRLRSECLAANMARPARRANRAV